MVQCEYMQYPLFLPSIRILYPLYFRGFVDNRQNEAADSEYEDDFEAGEDAEDEEDDDCRDMLMTRQWLDDQGRLNMYW